MSSSVDWYLSPRAAMTRCDLVAGAIAAESFQQEPRALEIAWVRREHAGLLYALARIADQADRADLFHHYMISRVWGPRARSYAALLRGWSIDSNGASGAVLKGWAESRFGLRPIWHRTALSQIDAQACFEAERERGADGAEGAQLDLLHVYAQDELARRRPGERWWTLWRGTHDAELYEVKRDGREALVEFNCVSSFTADREVAWEFGSRVWEVRVPHAKILCFPGLLPPGILQGESEVIVLGGDYRVRSLVA